MSPTFNVVDLYENHEWIDGKYDEHVIG